MSPTGLLAHLRRLADLAEARGAEGEAADWRHIADALEGTGVDRETPFAHLAGTSPASLRPALQHRVHTLLTQGPELALRAASDMLPWLLRRLLESGHVDSPSVAVLARHGIVTLDELEAALRDGRLRRHLPAQADTLRTAVEILATDRLSVPLGQAADLLDSLAALASAACPDLTNLTPAGDVRRFEPLVKWLAIAGVAPDPVRTLDILCALSSLQPVLHRTGSRAVVTFQQAEVDLRIAAPGEFGTVLHAATGSPAHLAAVRARHRVPRLWRREEDAYDQAGLAWIPPELRHDTGEIEAAALGRLPALVAREHMCGDLHMHTAYSDGRDSVVEMVQAAAALEYAYIAITDHSERSFASRTLSLDQLARQREEIAALRGRFPALVILHGVEVDIMPDGRLDFPDDVLEPLDIVLASLHDRAGHDGRRLTRRCLAAIRHPLVNIITHPANRMVGRDAGYDLDFPAIFEAAASTGTALEIDGAPGHLDLDGDLARAAVAAGATLVIDSDCHRASLLDRQMRLGVGTARRGWVEPRHVLNARSIDAVRAFVAAKRAAGPLYGS